MFVAVTRVHAPDAVLDRMMVGFRHGAPSLKDFPGFQGFELWRAPGSLEAVSRWDSRESMEAYRASPLFSAHHGPDSGQGGQAEAVSFDAEIVI